MMEISITLLILVVTCLESFVWGFYLQSVTSQKAALAATSGSAIHIIAAFTVISYMSDWRYIIPMVIGSWIGTYLIVRRDKLRSTKD